MDETEVEDGEACFSEDNSSIDPDVALSYIDEKLQDVLGHFRKDFEGGVFAENLGAKYGGYGSFLPTYQRSPLIRSHLRNRNEAQKFSSPESPNVVHAEGAPQNSTTPLEEAQSGKKFLVKDEHVLNKQANSSDKRTLKVRIKINSDNSAKEKAAIYSGFGLNTTPSSSMGNSPDGSSGMPSRCPGNLPESPGSILQTMTSFPIPGGLLLSPLTESLLCLEVKEKLTQNSSSSKAIRKISKQKEKKVVKKRENLLLSKGEIGMDPVDRRTILTKQEVDVKVENMESETLGQGPSFSCDDNPNLLCRKACDIIVNKGADMASRACQVVEENISGKHVEVKREESFESMCDQNGGNFEKRDFQGSSMAKISENKSRIYCRSDSNDSRGIVQSIRNKNYALSKADSDVSNCSRDPFGQKAVEKDEVKVPSDMEKSSSKGKKKSKKSQNCGDLASEAEGSLISGSYEVPMEKKSSKVCNVISKNDIQMVHGKCKGVQPETTGEQVINQTYHSQERPSGRRTTNSNHRALKKKQCASLNKPREISTQKNIHAQLVSDSSLKESGTVNHPSLLVGAASVTESAPPALVVIEEDWVLCDHCQKWRLLPYGTKPEQLPEKWMCSMLNWLPGMNSCNFSEDDTTQALHRLYQSDSQSNLKNHVDRVAPTAPSAEGLHFDGNDLNPSSNSIPNPRRKKHNLKEIHCEASNGGSASNVVKSRSLNDPNQPCSGSNLMSNSQIQHLSKSHNFVGGKSTHKQKEKQEKHVLGDAKEKNLKSKKAADQYKYGSPKRSRVGASSCDVKYLSASESLKITECSERETSLKKRKLKDWQESQSYMEASKGNENNLLESKVYVKEESSENEFRNAKKSVKSFNEGREFGLTKGDERLNCKGKATNLKNLVHGNEVYSLKKSQHARKLKTKGSASDDMDILKRDLGSGQFSMAATSSSSKVSDSRKSRSHFLEVKGSPVESVSSSPIHILNSDKLSPARGDNLRKSATGNGHIRMMDFVKKSSDKEGNIQMNQSGTSRRAKDSLVSHSESVRSSVLDFRDSHNGQKFGGNSRLRVESQDKHQSGNLVKDSAGALAFPCPDDLQIPHYGSEDKMNKNINNGVALSRGKPKKDYSLLPKGKDVSSGSNSESIKVKVSIHSEVPADRKESLRDFVETSPENDALLHGDSTDLKCGIKLVKDDRDGKLTRDSSQQNQKQAFNYEVSEGSDIIRVEPRGGSYSQVISSHVVKKESPACISPSVPRLRKRNTFDVVPVDSPCNGDSSKVLQQCNDASSSLGNDACSQASTALKKAEELKGIGDRLKDSGFGPESNDAYFQAVLKYLHAASLLETCYYNGNKHGEMSPVQIYSNTAKLCELCAHEYDKREDMAAAALAYKCAEVAYTRVVYCKTAFVNKDRLDLQATPQTVPHGESPSSSASDVDSLNNQVMVDKAALAKGVGSHAGNHVIAARNRPKLVRLLDFMEDVNSAMEASDSSLSAFAAANVNLEEPQNNEGIISVKRVIDFSFQDVDELIRLVRIAIDSISRQGFHGGKD